MSETRAWHFYAEDMLRFANAVLDYTQGMGQKAFVANRLVYDASLRNLERVGEAATHIPQHVREAHPAIPWRMVVVTRNRLIHGYLGIDDDTLWSIIRDDLPPLVVSLHAVLGRDATWGSSGRERLESPVPSDKLVMRRGVASSLRFPQ